MTEALLCQIIVYGFMGLMTLPLWFAALTKYEFRRQDIQAARELATRKG